MQRRWQTLHWPAWGGRATFLRLPRPASWRDWLGPSVGLGTFVGVAGTDLVTPGLVLDPAHPGDP